MKKRGKCYPSDVKKGHPSVLRLHPISPVVTLRKATSRASLILAWNEVAPEVFSRAPERFSSVTQALLLDLALPLLTEYVAREVELALQAPLPNRQASLA